MKTSGIFLLAHFVRLDKWSINEGTSDWWQLFICPGMKSTIHRRHVLLRIRLLHSQRSQFPPNCPVLYWSSLHSHQVSSLPNGPLINPRGFHTRQSWRVCGSLFVCVYVCVYLMLACARAGRPKTLPVHWDSAVLEARQTSGRETGKKKSQFHPLTKITKKQWMKMFPHQK